VDGGFAILIPEKVRAGGRMIDVEKAYHPGGAGCAGRS
jgi:hypothetical protein